MSEFDQLLLSEGSHDSKNKLAMIFICVSALFCFSYTIVFAIMGAYMPAWFQLGATVLFVLSYYGLKFGYIIRAKILSMFTSLAIVALQAIFFFGSAYGFHFMIIAHIVVVVMLFNYNRKHANVYLVSYLAIAITLFLYIENLEQGIYQDYVNLGFQKLFYNITVGCTILALIVIMYYFSKEIDLTKEKLFVMTLTDDLTNLYNRRILMEYGQKLFNDNEEAKFSLLLIDVDYFKTVNDTYGHDVGDLVLVTLAKLLTDQMRMYDMVARYGGEEFAVILPRTDKQDAVKIAERILYAVETMPFKIDDFRTIQLTISIGVSYRTIDFKDFSAMVSRADEALYRAKENGRNQLVTY